MLLGLVQAAVCARHGLGRCGRRLVVAASGLVAAKDTLNWLTGVKDEFTEKSRATPLGALAALPETIGVGIFVAGVLTALQRPLPGARTASAIGMTERRRSLTIGHDGSMARLNALWHHHQDASHRPQQGGAKTSRAHQGSSEAAPSRIK